MPQAVESQSLLEIIEQAESTQQVQQAPISILLVGRTGAGKSSLINSLFQQQLATVDLLPSTTECQRFTWQDDVLLWDAPGYEQVGQPQIREKLLQAAHGADVLVLVNPALEPSLQMDADFLQAVRTERSDLPVLMAVTQVDRLRPMREWQPPYDWQLGDRPKEVAIREAVFYRLETLQTVVQQVIPVVTADPQLNRDAWNMEALSMLFLDTLTPARQLRIARWFTSIEAKAATAAQVINQLAERLSMAQGGIGMIRLLVAQVVQLIPPGKGIAEIAKLLTEHLPVEQAPVVVIKVWLAWNLFQLFQPNGTVQDFPLDALRPVLLQGSDSLSPKEDIRALGQALVELWTQQQSPENLQQRVDFYRQRDKLG